MNDGEPTSGDGPRRAGEPSGPPPGSPDGEWVRVPERRQSRRLRRRRAAALILLVVLLVTVVGGVTAYTFIKDYFAVGARGPAVSVNIPPESSLHQIALILEKTRVVPHARAFEYRAKRDGHEFSFRPGRYDLYVNEPYDDLVAALLKGEVKPVVKVTIPEGLTVRQSADLVAGSVAGFQARTYVDITLKHPLPFRLEGFASGGPLEGMLFPATYEVSPDVSEADFARLQLGTFKERLAEIDLRKARAHNLTEYDVTIIGSMIEREIQVAAERPLAAAVIWNRLRLGMPLQIDATVQYALPQYKEQLTFEDLKVQSPYNTYLHTGLPPTPICNPGAAALRAAAHPAAVDYLYYVARNDGSGGHYFSANYAQFLKDKARAQSQ